MPRLHYWHSPEGIAAQVTWSAVEAEVSLTLGAAQVLVASKLRVGLTVTKFLMVVMLENVLLEAYSSTAADCSAPQPP